MEAREIKKQCTENGCAALRSSALTRLVEAGQKYGYDLIVQVGLLRYLCRLQRQEIRDVLRNEHGIELSTGSVSALCDRFLIYFEALHVARSPSIRQALGEYPLHSTPHVSVAKAVCLSVSTGGKAGCYGLPAFLPRALTILPR
jgi:hypothetical protein